MKSCIFISLSALLHLKSPAILDNFVSPICLFPPGFTFPAGKECYVTGWGHTQWRGPKPDILREAKVKLVHQDQCNAEKSYEGAIHNRALCAGFEEGGVDACQYDSGGPLACEQDGLWYLTGVVSWGHNCGDPHKYGVYADMEDMTEWVRETIKEAEKSYVQENINYTNTKYLLTVNTEYVNFNQDT